MEKLNSNLQIHRVKIQIAIKIKYEKNGEIFIPVKVLYLLYLF